MSAREAFWKAWREWPGDPNDRTLRIEYGLAAYEKAQWQPIETAPKDGSWILVSDPSGTWMDSARFYEGAWCSWPTTICQYGPEEDPPTHWMPLPEPPNA